MVMRQVMWRGLVVVALGVATTACALRSPEIGEIKDNSARYLDHKVVVRGTVTSAWNVPFMPFALYKVDDGTGELTVISRETRTPRKGAQVRVTGKVQDVAALGDRSIGLHLEERNVDVLRHR
jgi:DNA/RNA endonuclease YhcR with UshA esterase domain